MDWTDLIDVKAFLWPREARLVRYCVDFNRYGGGRSYCYNQTRALFDWVKAGGKGMG